MKSYAISESKANIPRNESNGSSEPEPFAYPRKHVTESLMLSTVDRRHLEDVTNHQQDLSPPQNNQNHSRDSNKALIIDDALTKLDPVSSIY